MGLTAPAVRPGVAWWLAVAAAFVVLMALPSQLNIAQQFSTSIIFILALLALSMSFLWGYAGILSFGQTAFFGLGGYGYAVIAINSGWTTTSALAAILLAMGFAAILGYFMIYGRISDIYLSVITLVVTLIFEKAMKSTSGEQYKIGTARLNGQNGIPTVPSLKLPWNPAKELGIDGVFYLAAGLLVVVYIALRLLLTTPFGRVLVGIRENERRVELLGYDVRRYKLAAFVLCGAIAGLAGVLFGVWNNFVAPEMFGLNRASQVVIWVIVGGKSTLIGPIVGVGLLHELTMWLGENQLVPTWFGGNAKAGQVPLVLGIILMCFVLLAQQGLIPAVAQVLAWLRARLRGQAP